MVIFLSLFVVFFVQCANRKFTLQNNVEDIVSVANFILWYWDRVLLHICRCLLEQL